MFSAAIQRQLIVQAWNEVVKVDSKLAKTIASTVIKDVNNPLTEKVFEIIKKSPQIASKMTPEKLQQFCGDVVYWKSKTHPAIAEVGRAMAKAFFGPFIRSRL
ncbi:MAG TPA: hypothetical protein VLF61_00660 [Rhabdochlamydiaceae bacterium]|nr:hypothetical protein [Rhabdochlamydiaceae bacterium]